MTNTSIQDELLVVGALRSQGVTVETVWDLVNTSAPYPHAIDLLIQLLPVVHDVTVKEGIVRALTVREAKGKASQALISEFKSAGFGPEVHGLKWAIGNALHTVALPHDAHEILELTKDDRNASTRQFLCRTLGKLKYRASIPTLIRLLQVTELCVPAMEGLRSLLAVEARASIEPLLSHPMKHVRVSATKALLAFDKEIARRAKKRPRN